MILNYIKRLTGWRAEEEDYANITFKIQKQILKRRYAKEKQSKSYGNQPKFNRPIVRHINLTSKSTENVILLRKKNYKN